RRERRDARAIHGRGAGLIAPARADVRSCSLVGATVHLARSNDPDASSNRSFTAADVRDAVSSRTIAARPGRPEQPWDAPVRPAGGLGRAPGARKPEQA